MYFDEETRRTHTENKITRSTPARRGRCISLPASVLHEIELPNREPIGHNVDVVGALSRKLLHDHIQIKGKHSEITSTNLSYCFASLPWTSPICYCLLVYALNINAGSNVFFADRTLDFFRCVRLGTTADLAQIVGRNLLTNVQPDCSARPARSQMISMRVFATLDTTVSVERPTTWQRRLAAK